MFLYPSISSEFACDNLVFPCMNLYELNLLFLHFNILFLFFSPVENCLLFPSLNYFCQNRLCAIVMDSLKA